MNECSVTLKNDVSDLKKLSQVARAAVHAMGAEPPVNVIIIMPSYKQAVIIEE